MPLADTAKLVASLELQDKFSKTAAAAERSFGRLEKQSSTFGKIGSRAKEGLGAAANNVKTLGVIAAGAIASQVALGVQSLAQLEEVKNQTDAVIKSTQGAAGITAAQIRQQAEALEDLSTVDDKVIQAGENMLLTFKNIRNETGAGNDIFNQATKTLLDLSTAMGTEPKQAAIQLGKALNDPIKGITALTRVGVTFTEKQKEEITQLVKAGDTMKAQKIILRELNSEFGGSAEAFGKGPGAALRRFGDAVEGMQQALATGFLPLIETVSKKVQTFLGDPKVLAQIKAFGVDLAGGIDSLIETGTKLPWAAIGDAFKLMGTGARALLDAFTGLPSWVQTAVITGWGLNKLTGGALGGIVGELGKGLIKGVLGMNAGVVNINAATVNGGGIPGAPGGPGGGGLVKGAIKFVLPIAAGVLIANAIREMAGISPEESADRQRHGQFGPRSAANVPPKSLGPVPGTLGSGPVKVADPILAGLEKRNASEYNRTIRSEMRQSSIKITRGIERHAASERGDLRELQRTNRQVSSKTAQAVERMRGVESASRETTGVLRRKNFSPKIDVEANFQANITVNSVTRKVVQMQRAAGRGFTSTGLIQ